MITFSDVMDLHDMCDVRHSVLFFGVLFPFPIPSLLFLPLLTLVNPSHEFFVQLRSSIFDLRFEATMALGFNQKS